MHTTRDRRRRGRTRRCRASWTWGRCDMATTPDAEKAPGGQPPPVDQRRGLVIIGAPLLGVLLAPPHQTIVATPLPTIAGDLHRLSHPSRGVTSYLPATTESSPPTGRRRGTYRP